MFGVLIPDHLFTAWANLIETPQTILFVHRWFAWAGILLVSFTFVVMRKLKYPREVLRGMAGLIGLVALQIILGVLTTLSRVHITVALLHQANALALFGLAVFFIHRFRALDRANWEMKTRRMEEG
jgi:cytochrome c oxidase assembly protein subunit 15